MSSITRLFAVCALSLGSLYSTGCGLDCGPGTTEVDGECIPAELGTPDSACGPGTSADSSGVCQPANPPTVCGANTVESRDPDTGEITCEGTGGGDCSSSPFVCNVPGSGATVCGQLLDTFTGAPIVEGDGSDASECAGDETEGPCAWTLVFESVAQAAVPDGTLFRDKCGRYRLEEFTPQALDLVSVTAIDMADTATHVPTNIVFRAPGGSASSGNTHEIVSLDAIASWETDAPMVAGLQANGGIIMRFLNPEATAPVAGLTVGPGDLSANDFYFEAAAVPNMLDDGTGLTATTALGMVLMNDTPTGGIQFTTTDGTTCWDAGQPVPRSPGAFLFLNLPGEPCP